MSRPPDVGQQGHEAGVLDRLGELALVLAREPRALARLDLALRRQELDQVAGVLVLERLGRLDLGTLDREAGEARAMAALGVAFSRGGGVRELAHAFSP